MHSIPPETRREAYEAIQPKRKTCGADVLAALQSGPKTVSEMLDSLFRGERITLYDRNSVAPRVSELYKSGAIVAVGKRVSRRTGRSETVWRLAASRAEGGHANGTTSPAETPTA